MPVRASVACMLGALIVVGVIWLGGTALSPPEVMVLREAPVVSSPTPAPSPVAAASPVVPRGRAVRVIAAGADEVNLRAEPRTSGERLKGLSDGVELELLGRDIVVGGRTWRNVRDSTDGTEGWVAAELLGPAR